MHSSNTFGVRTRHGQPRTHKTHHSPDLGEATTFLLIVLSAILHKGHIQMAFCPGTPKWEFQNSHNYDSCDFGGAYLQVKTFDCNEVWSKVVSLVESFPTVCHMLPTH
jgi:hypothetical protein